MPKRGATDRAIALRRAAYAPDNPLLLALVSERGSLAVDAGEHAIARTSFAEALPTLERAWGVTVDNARQSQATMAAREGDHAGCVAEVGPDPCEIERESCAAARAKALLPGALAGQDLAAVDAH